MSKHLPSLANTARVYFETGSDGRRRLVINSMNGEVSMADVDAFLMPNGYPDTLSSTGRFDGELVVWDFNEIEKRRLARAAKEPTP